jgi:hypothetical protein
LVEERFIQSFGGETLRFNLEDLDADIKIGPQEVKRDTWT